MRYQLTVYGTDGVVRLERLEAQSQEAAVHHFVSQGAAVISVRAEQTWFGGLGSRRSTFPLLLISQELLSLLRAGVGLVEAFETLNEKEQSGDTRLLLDRVLQDLRSGKSLSAALEGYPQSFPPLYVATVRASEKTGDLVDALGRYVAYRTQLEDAKKKIVSALVYPVLLFAVGGMVTLFLLVYVVPRFSKIFEDRATEIPLLTQVLLAWGSFLNNHPWILAALVVGTAAAIVAAVARPAFRALLLRLVRAFPKAGARLRMYQLARLYRTLGMLLKSGTPIAAALGMVRELVDDSMRADFDRAAARIREGTPTSVAMQESGLTTPVAVRILRVGEQTGNMAAMMERLAELFDEENARALEMFSRVFEPVLMALIGLVIGAIVVLMYLPIFELAANVQ
jgi:general secretion pathway protein F